VATQAENPRSATPEEIRDAGARTGTEIELAGEVANALERARSWASDRASRQERAKPVIVVTGSIYLVGEAMRALELRA
jgi:folylpolyglutamate synthase/dihydropteroate synthase